ncbi:MAG: molybdopterin cofactor-binding domain-containing protein [Planctomycetota bacterium]
MQDEMITLPLFINGEQRTVAFPCHHTLLEVLREECALTGTKHGCELGECGTCTVLVDGEPVLSCLALAAEMTGRKIETVEGLQRGNRLHPLQATFADLGAAQCGYCTPGILMASKALLRHKPDPSQEDVREALSGNLCRCTGYLKIIEAVRWAAALERGETECAPPREAFYGAFPATGKLRPMGKSVTRKEKAVQECGAYQSSDFRIIGKPFRRVDGRAKSTGQTRFADDLIFPRMVHLRLARSTASHALIRRINTEPAAQLPGVLGILTGKDFPIPFGILPVSQDEHALCLDKVRFVGDPVAAVAALTEDQAYAACDAICIDYKTLTTIANVTEALQNPEPRIHEYGDTGNIHKRVSMQFGDVEKGFAEAEVVLEDTFYFEGNTHLPMEQHATVAVPEDEGRVTVYSSTQTPHYLHRALAKVLELPASRVRVIACPNGGGFGGKSDPFNHEIVAAKMALLLGRPVKICLNREEVFYCHRGRHPVLMHTRTGFKKDGTITAQHLRTVLDGGGYGSYGVASTYYTGALQTVTYRLPKYSFDSIRVFTNKPPCGPKRGHGTPQPRCAFEVHLDKVAHRLGIDPADLRLNNLVPPESVTANYLKIGSMGLGDCIKAVVEGSHWRERYGKLPYGRGLGLACGAYLCGAGLPIYWNHMPQSGVQLKLDRSGGVAVFCGEIEIGQGSDSVLAACVAEVLGIELDDIRLCVADTDLTPVDLGSYSSRVTLMVGNAAIQAAERAREIIAKAVAEELDVPVQRLVFAERRVFDLEAPDHGLDFAEAVATAEARFGTLGSTGSYTPPRSPGRYRGAGVGPSPAYSYSAAVLEVEVDPETGLYRVNHVWIAHDVGRSINPVLVMGQIEGSVYMALGEAMMEEQVFRRLPKKRSHALVHKHPSMLEYKSPTFHEMPPVTSYIIEDPDPDGPFGAKEVGQGPLLPVIPALPNAIFDAVGVRIDQVPVAPHMIMKALQAQEKGKEPRFGPESFPEVDFGVPLRIPTQDEGGDGQATNQPQAGVRRGSGTMKDGS